MSIFWFFTGCSVTSVAFAFYIWWIMSTYDDTVEEYRKCIDAWREASDKWRKLATKDDSDWWKN